MQFPGTSRASIPTKVDSLRERELYRYYQPLRSPTAEGEEHGQPEDSTLSVDAASSPDTTLTALAQLCTLRLGAQRAMISVIDREKQYFIAESTKTLNLSDTSKCEKDGDGLWVGCSTVDKSGRLCEKTIELPVVKGKAPCFTVTDLSADERFNTLPFVTGYPFFKFYAGTPLTTKKGINIGSLFVLDDRIRPKLTLDQEESLGTIAQIAMKHMEITSEAEERRKVMRMSMGLNAFVEGKSQFHFHADFLYGYPHEKLQRISPSGSSKPLPGSSKRASIGSSESRLRQSSSKRSTEPLRHESQGQHSSASEKSSGESQGSHAGGLPRHGHSVASELSVDSDGSYEDSDSGPSSADSGHGGTCARAANLLSESLDLSGPPRRGGVVFFDTTTRFWKQGHKSAASMAEKQSESTPAMKPAAKPAEVISQSAGEGSFTPLDEDLLFNFLRRYPRGKLWSFDLDGSLSSSEDDAVSPTERRRSEKSEESRVNRRQMEAKKLQNHFPGCRQLLFTGLWDAASSRWFLGGFAWTTSSRRIFSTDAELNFFRAFGNSVTAEVSRQASIAADRQKADFIGSISHEFRSPLHGILASAEFLSETNADAFQSSLVDTISSCGRTLLDTINHILDYSKINSFERTWRNVRKSGGSKRPPVSVAHHHMAAKQEQAPPMLNIYASINIASIAEEVVEGVYAGQIYQDISSTEATDFSLGAKAEAKNRGLHMAGQGRISKVSSAKPVDVILDIPREDYTFITQPGALRRVVMNIFGNALKYTQRGSILVQLSLDPIESIDGMKHDPLQERILQIKVTDTGKGISKEYLRTSLFNPFCQEDVLASGTGLGLSIVKSIATMLNGTIDIQSEVGVGTQVTVRLPLSRVPGTDTPVGTPSTVTDQSQDDSMTHLAAEYTTTTVALYGFESDLRQTGHVVQRCIEDWYGLKTIAGLSRLGPEHADLVVLDEKALPAYLKQRAMDIPAVVLCSSGMRPSPASHFDSTTFVEYVSKPFGPYKLAKGLRVCLDKDKAFKSGRHSTLSFPLKRNDSTDSDADTHVPDLNHLTLETDDARAPIEVQTNGIVTAVATENAQMALDNSHSNLSSLPTSGDTTMIEGQDFPFPSQDDAEEAKKADAAVRELSNNKPQLAQRATAPLVKTLPPVPNAGTSQAEMAALVGYQTPGDIDTAKKELLNSNEGKPASLTASNVALHNGESLPAASPSSEPLERKKRPPRLLLVDDNKINLRLLETYMKKRRYTFVDSAENGQLAVQAAAAQEQGYDIIFMDISMPVMNGFEATRAIRNIEEEARERQGETPSSPALIIALTGLASGRDQSEAFTSGVDLFLTKPVSFKDVGKLLDNWEQHGGLRGVGEKESNGGL